MVLLGFIREVISILSVVKLRIPDSNSLDLDIEEVDEAEDELDGVHSSQEAGDPEDHPESQRKVFYIISKEPGGIIVLIIRSYDSY